jgi:toxin ParE1/3/4
MRTAQWTKSAQSDLAAIDDHYREPSPSYADRVGSAAIAAGRFLAERPYAGPALDGGQCRKWLIARTPYVLIYRVVPSGVQIVRVVHAATDWYGRY